MQKKQVVIVGNVGTGKSTLLQSLTEHADIHVLPADELYLSNPFFHLSKQDPQRWALTNDLWFLFQRYKLMRDALEKTHQQHLVVDSGIFMSYVYGRAHAEAEKVMTTDEWQFFEECFDHCCVEITSPDLVILLTAPFEVIRQRIEQRNRNWEVSGYFEYLKSLQQGLEHLTDKLTQLNIPYLEIETQQRTPAQVAQEVYHAISS